MAAPAGVGLRAALHPGRCRGCPTRDVPDVQDRAGRIRAAAAGWSRFWDGHLDLDALAWETGEHLRDITIAAEQIERATTQAHHYWAALYGDDPLLLSLPGMGPMTAPTIRAFLGDASTFATAKAAASYVGLTPSTWSSGTVVQPSRAITKEGPAVLRLAFYQAAGGARRVDPQLAACYQHLMVERGHCHTQATVAVARKLAERTWTVLTRGEPYQFRDVDGQAITRAAAKTLARHDYAASPRPSEPEPEHVARPRTAPSSPTRTNHPAHRRRPLR